jgi:hypothetical protein
MLVRDCRRQETRNAREAGRATRPIRRQRRPALWAKQERQGVRRDDGALEFEDLPGIPFPAGGRRVECDAIVELEREAITSHVI